MAPHTAAPGRAVPDTVAPARRCRLSRPRRPGPPRRL